MNYDKIWFVSKDAVIMTNAIVNTTKTKGEVSHITNVTFCVCQKHKLMLACARSDDEFSYVKFSVSFEPLKLN